MNDKEAIEMMKHCRDEILTLRGVIDRLAPKADAWDQMTKVLNLLPRQSQGFSRDIAWDLEQRIKELSAAPAEPATETEGV